MEEGLFLDRIALHSADISPGDVKLAGLIEAHFADPRLALKDWAAVPAGEAADAIALYRLVKFSLAGMSVQDFAESGQGGNDSCYYFKSETAPSSRAEQVVREAKERGIDLLFFAA